MKKQFPFVAALMLLSGSLQSFRPLPPQTTVNGAWLFKTGSQDQVLIFQDGYFSHTTFDRGAKKFGRTYGGVYRHANGKLNVKLEFDSNGGTDVGKERVFTASLAGRQLQSDISGSAEQWTPLDDGKEKLSGVWRITSRLSNGEMAAMPKGDRKTLKLMSATRFQWIAINPATREFFGTGGGTYDFSNGRYTEHIEFFSRDSSRVGASLSFDGSIKDGVWHHSGKSSKGEALQETWGRETY